MKNSRSTNNFDSALHNETVELKKTQSRSEVSLLMLRFPLIQSITQLESGRKQLLIRNAITYLICNYPLSNNPQGYIKCTRLIRIVIKYLQTQRNGGKWTGKN